MRCVLAPPVAGPPPPERAALEAVRHLGRQFPDARVREVPLVRAAELDARADPSGSTRVWLALEALQVTGSFQVRGALIAVARASASIPQRRHVVAPSVGNHGIAVAYAACILGMSATVVVPSGIPRTKREKIERYGAELVVASTERYDAAVTLAKRIAETQGAAFVAAGEDVHVMLGNGGSLGFEIMRGLGGVPERALAPFGDGGLVTGMAWAFGADAVGAEDCSVWGVQSEACCAMATSLESGRAVVAGGDEPTLAEELTEVAPAGAFEHARAAIAGIGVVSEEQIAAAMAHAYQDMGLVLEGTAAVALAPVLFGLPERLRGGDVVVVLTGRNVDPDRLNAVLARART